MGSGKFGRPPGNEQQPAEPLAKPAPGHVLIGLAPANHQFGPGVAAAGWLLPTLTHQPTCSFRPANSGMSFVALPPPGLGSGKVPARAGTRPCRVRPCALCCCLPEPLRFCAACAPSPVQQTPDWIALAVLLLLCTAHPLSHDLLAPWLKSHLQTKRSLFPPLAFQKLLGCVPDHLAWPVICKI